MQTQLINITFTTRNVSKFTSTDSFKNSYFPCTIYGCNRLPQHNPHKQSRHSPSTHISTPQNKYINADS